jgi:hypothetical protein
LASFDETPEVRKEGGNFINISSTKQNMYPFTIHHANTNERRRYTLYTQTPTARAKWYSALVDAIGVRKARQDANKVFSSPLRASTCPIMKPSGLDLNHSTTVSSVCLHALGLHLGRTSLVVFIVPPRFVGCLVLMGSTGVDPTVSVSKAELPCCRMYQWHIRWCSCRLL